MLRRLKSTHILTPDGICDGYVYINGDRIAAVTAEEYPYDVETDFGNLWLAPGFIDMHVHGAAGYDFCDSDESGIAAAADYHLKHGTTALLPTLTSCAYSATLTALERISSCMRHRLSKAQLLGVHLEGPYFSLAQCGAQSPDIITAPQEEQYKEILRRYGSCILRWSYAPERDTEQKFCRALVEHGILPSAGHTDAIGDEMQEAFDAGCRLVTHLYSCTSSVTRQNCFRRLGVIEYAFLNDQMDVEIIADGAHLPADLVRMILKIKGTDRVSLVTDALSVTGTDQTEAFVGTVPCILEDGVCKLADRSAFAGSIATADRLIRFCTREVGIPLPEAVRMMTENPARLLGLRKGRIEAGYDADLVVFDDDIRVTSVFVGGQPTSEITE